MVAGYILYYQISQNVVLPKQAIEQGIAQVKSSQGINSAQEALLRVQLAITDYIASNGSPPPSLEALIPKYFDSLPLDPETHQAFPYSRDGMSFHLGRQLQLASAAAPKSPGEPAAPSAAAPAPAGGSDNFINPNTMEISDFVYDPAGMRDPFIPFDLRQRHAYDDSIPPLERYALGQLRVTAIASDAEGVWTALVEDESGKGYTVHEGSKIGNAQGVIVSIEKDKVNVVESHTDFTGHEEKKAAVLKIQAGDQKYIKARGAKAKKKK